MKRIITFSLLVILAITITGCNKKGDMKLRIKESSWSGWSENYKPKEVTKKYEIEEGKKYTIKTGGLSDFIFTITKVNKDNIVIETTEAFSEGESVDLNSTKKEFTVYYDKELELTTPTMDSGDIYYLQIVK